MKRPVIPNALVPAPGKAAFHREQLDQLRPAVLGEEGSLGVVAAAATRPAADACGVRERVPVFSSHFFLRIVAHLYYPCIAIAVRINTYTAARRGFNSTKKKLMKGLAYRVPKASLSLAPPFWGRPNGGGRLEGP